MEMIENPMVLDCLWEPDDLAFIKGKLSEAGYTEMGTGVFVPECDAFDYAVRHCVKDIPECFHEIEWKQEFKDMLVDWFYSDNWIWSGGYGSD